MWKAIRIRAASQFMQSGWVYELGEMDKQTVAGLLPGVPELEWPEWTPIGGYVDYQLASIVVLYLHKLANELLSELAEKVFKLEYDPSLRDTFLILLTCPQGEIVFQAGFAARRQSPVSLRQLFSLRKATNIGSTDTWTWTGSEN